MDLGFGGPVWHASISQHNAERPLPLWAVDERRLWLAAMAALEGVGDPALGEWRERGTVAVHLRRRLTHEEWGNRPWGMDYRNTPEGEARIAVVRPWLPAGYREDRPA